MFLFLFGRVFCWSWCFLIAFFFFGSDWRFCFVVYFVGSGFCLVVRHKGKLTTTSYQLQTLERLCVTVLDGVVSEARGFKMGSAHDESVYRKDPHMERLHSRIEDEASVRCAEALSRRLMLPASKCRVCFEGKQWASSIILPAAPAPPAAEATPDIVASAAISPGSQVLRSAVLENLREIARGQLESISVTSLLPYLSPTSILDMFAAQRALTERPDNGSSVTVVTGTACLESRETSDDLHLSPCTPATQASGDIFCEKQEPGKARCGMHALNNLIGHRLFEPSEMTRSCDVFLAESHLRDKENGVSSLEIREDHENSSGWYSSEVMAFALRRTFQFDMIFSPLDAKCLDRFHKMDCVGVLTHHVDNDGRGVHWTSLRRIGSQVWFLDSCVGPVLLPESGLAAHVQKHPGKCYPVLCKGPTPHPAAEECMKKFHVDFASGLEAPAQKTYGAVEIVEPFVLPQEIEVASALVNQRKKIVDELAERVRMVGITSRGHEKSAVDYQAKVDMPGGAFWRPALLQHLATLKDVRCTLRNLLREKEAAVVSYNRARAEWKRGISAEKRAGTKADPITPLAYFSERIRSSKDIVLEVVKSDGIALSVASPELKNDKEVVVAAVRQNGKAAKYASVALRDDDDVVLAAYRPTARTTREKQATSNQIKKPECQHGVAAQLALEDKNKDDDVVRAARVTQPRIVCPKRSKSASPARSVAASVASSSTGNLCEHQKRKRQCAECSPCDCTTDEVPGKRRRRDNCADCNPCECTRNNDKGERRRKDKCKVCVGLKAGGVRVTPVNTLDP